MFVFVCVYVCGVRACVVYRDPHAAAVARVPDLACLPRALFGMLTLDGDRWLTGECGHHDVLAAAAEGVSVILTGRALFPPLRLCCPGVPFDREGGIGEGGRVQLEGNDPEWCNNKTALPFLGPLRRHASGGRTDRHLLLTVHRSHKHGEGFPEADGVATGRGPVQGWSF